MRKRRFLRSFGGILAVGIAGCSGKSEISKTTETSEPSKPTEVTVYNDMVTFEWFDIATAPSVRYVEGGEFHTAEPERDVWARAITMVENKSDGYIIAKLGLIINGEEYEDGALPVSVRDVRPREDHPDQKFETRYETVIGPGDERKVQPIFDIPEISESDEIYGVFTVRENEEDVDEVEVAPEEIQYP